MSNKTERLGEVLCKLLDEMIGERMNNIEVDNIDGLESTIDDAVGKAVESAMQDFEVDADGVRRLDDTIESIVDNILRDKLPSEIRSEVREQLSDTDMDSTIQRHVIAAMETPQFEAMLDKAVQASLLRLVSRVVGGLLPINAPVQQPAQTPTESPVRFNSEGGIVGGLGL